MLTVKSEMRLQDFEAWGGAKNTLKYLTTEEIDQLESCIVEMFPDGLTDTELNDFLWFEDDFIAELLGYDNFEEITER